MLRRLSRMERILRLVAWGHGSGGVPLCSPRMSLGMAQWGWLAIVSPWTRGRLEAVGTPMKTIKPTQAVATILNRYQRWRNCQVPFTATDAYADAITRVCGDDVDLDPVERGLIHLKRQKVISGQRLVTLLARHQREIRPE